MKRSGSTETLSISLSKAPLRVLRRRAKQVHRGNLSAAIAEAAELMRRQMAMDDLAAELERVHGALTAEERAIFAEELEPRPRRPRKKRAA